MVAKGTIISLENSCYKFQLFSSAKLSFRITQFLGIYKIARIFNKMRLSLINFFKKTVPGHIFRGKKRLVKPVSLKAMETLRREYERQEKMMLLLRHPYLTVEESAGHVKDLKKSEAKIAKWNDDKTMKKLKPHVTLEDRLNHLKVKEAWD